MATHNLLLCGAYGQPYVDLPLGPDARFEYVKSVSRTGIFTIELPYRIPDRYLTADNLIEFYRGPTGAAGRRLDFLGWLRTWSVERRSDGSVGTLLKGHDANGLLERRIVAYDADDTKAYANNDPDVIIRDVFYQNFLSGATDVYRDLNKVQGLPRPYAPNISLHTWSKSFSVTNVQLNFAWWRVSELFQKLHEAALYNDTSNEKTDTVYFGFRAAGIEGSGYKRPILVFEVKFGHWGRDRTWAASKPGAVIFSNANGNLVNEYRTHDYRNEINAMYAGGQGAGADRIISQVVDTARTTRSPWARVEGWVDARNQTTSDQVTSVAWAELAAHKPRITAGGDLLDTEFARYGRDWYHGDKVTAEIFGKNYNGVILKTRLQIEDGEETINASIVHQGAV